MEFENIINLINEIDKMTLFIGFSILFFYMINFLKNKFILFSIFILPGVFIHELSHLIMSYISMGKPIKFSVLPQKVKNGYIMGYVLSRNIKWYNALFIGLAPLVWIPIAYYIMPMILIQKNIYIFILETYLLTTILYASIPSITDFKLAIKYSWIPITIIVTSGIIYIYLYYDKFK